MKPLTFMIIELIAYAIFLYLSVIHLQYFFFRKAFKKIYDAKTPYWQIYKFKFESIKENGEIIK